MRENGERSARKIPSKTEKNGRFRGTVRFFGKKGKLLIIPEKILFVKRFYEKTRRKRKNYTGSSPYTAIFAAVSVLFRSSVTVMTPTPPGTGVI